MDDFDLKLQESIRKANEDLDRINYNRYAEACARLGTTPTEELESFKDIDGTQDKVVSYLSEHGKLSSKDVSFSDSFPFNEEEYLQWAKKMVKCCDEEKCKYKYTTFPALVIPFEANGSNFVLRWMTGQACTYDSYTKDAWDKWEPTFREMVTVSANATVANTFGGGYFNSRSGAK